MSIIWFLMILLSVTILLFNNPELVISTMLDSSAQAVELIISLLGIYAVWLGILEILDQSGLSEKLAKMLNPIIKFLFKTDNKEVNKYIAINMSSNILGLGNAATPSGIKAMQLLDNGLEKASFSAIMLLVINSISLQLIPTTVIGLREKAGSLASTNIIIPTLISSLITCFFAVFCVFALSKCKRRAK